ncbi:MAG TPA: hypothetical protein VKW09_12735 [bacterium]|nr:hypothetical protein [bacterium]
MRTGCLGLDAKRLRIGSLGLVVGNLGLRVGSLWWDFWNLRLGIRRLELRVWGLG